MREHEVEAEWTSSDGSTHELLRLGWENGGWTADGQVQGLVDGDVHWAMRLDEDWHIRQFLLFRDDPEPDLWFVADGFGGWSEMNGVRRDDLAGCVAFDMGCTLFGHTPHIRRWKLAVGASADALIGVVDPETLHVAPVRRRYLRVSEHRWRVVGVIDGTHLVEFDVDRNGLVLDHPAVARRLA